MLWLGSSKFVDFYSYSHHFTMYCGVYQLEFQIHTKNKNLALDHHMSIYSYTVWVQSSFWDFFGVYFHFLMIFLLKLWFFCLNYVLQWQSSLILVKKKQKKTQLFCKQPSKEHFSQACFQWYHGFRKEYSLNICPWLEQYYNLQKQCIIHVQMTGSRNKHYCTMLKLCPAVVAILNFWSTKKQSL